MYEIEYELREEDLTHFNELLLKDNQDLQKNLRKNRLIVPGIMFFIGMFYYVYYHDMMTTAYITFLAVGWGIISPYMMKMDMRRQFLESYTESERAGMLGVHKLTIEPTELSEKSPGGKHRTPWADMLRVEYLEKYIYIFIDMNSAIIIPLERVSSGDVDKFSQQAEDMIERLS
jgi:hypothetical protein